MLLTVSILDLLLLSYYSIESQLVNHSPLNGCFPLGALMSKITRNAFIHRLM